MRLFFAIAILFAAPVFGQSGEWDPTPYNAAGIRFHDDLDFFLTSYTKPEIKAMRKEVSTWRMNFDKMMKATVADIRTYSEGGNMTPKTHPFTLPVVGTESSHSLTDSKGRVRVFMFGSITNPPARAQLPLWDKLRSKYDTAQVDIFAVYGHELHPGDKKKFRRYPVPKTEAEKAAYAKEFKAMTALPVLLDGMDDKVFNAYGRAPNGAYIIDADGRLVFRATWADSRKIEEIVDRLLQWYAGGRTKL